jgi:transcriptional regulator with XRE-family HTH domain
MKKPNTFGDLLRQLRTERGVTAGDVARELGTTVTYVAGVETGRHPPMTDKRIGQVAALLKLDPSVLLRAKGVDRGQVDVPLPRGPVAAQMVLEFARGDRDWNDSDLDEMLRRHGYIREQKS